MQKRERYICIRKNQTEISDDDFFVCIVCLFASFTIAPKNVSTTASFVHFIIVGCYSSHQINQKLDKKKKTGNKKQIIMPPASRK